MSPRCDTYHHFCAQTIAPTPFHRALPIYLRITHSKHVPILHVQGHTARSPRCHAERGSANGAAPPSAKRPVVVWFKHDLRTHDHAGLSKAIASGRPVICFFCFDTATLSDQLTHLWGPAVVHGAVHDLRKTLEGLGCPLVVRTGDTVQELLALVAEVDAEVVSGHSEVESQWLQAECAIEQSARPRRPRQERCSTRTRRASGLL